MIAFACIKCRIVKKVFRVEILKEKRLKNIQFSILCAVITAMISYNVVVGDTLSKVLVRFIPSLGSSMGSVRFFIVFLVTLVSSLIERF